VKEKKKERTNTRKEKKQKTNTRSR
jgi:hypothetical protein